MDANNGQRVRRVGGRGRREDTGKEEKEGEPSLMRLGQHLLIM
jgi:hypothetical protein